MSYRSIYVTTSSVDEARELGRRLVESRLVACVNIIDGMESIYRWQGEVCEAREAILLAKSRSELVPAIVARVTEWHTYDCPCIVALPIGEGHEAYLQWIDDNTQPENANPPSAS